MTAWIVLTILSVLVYVTLVAVILPAVFLKSSRKHSSIQDRGFKKVQEQDGGYCLYEPEPSVRRYISEYAISETPEGKRLVCKTNGEISYLDYDVALYGRDNKIFRTVRIRELLAGNGYTREVRLPYTCSYVSLTLNRVDNLVLQKRSANVVRNVRLALFSIFWILCVGAEAFALKICLGKLFGGIYAESYLFTMQSIIVTAIFAGAIALISAVAVVIAIKSRSHREERERNHVGS
jgi:hypothetical protein